MKSLHSNYIRLLSLFILILFEAAVAGETHSQSARDQAENSRLNGDTANFFEGFENVGNLTNQGWIFRNQSSPLGNQSWMQGFIGNGWPAPQAGAGYMAVTSKSTDQFGGRVSNWAILPAILGQQAGDAVHFYLIDVSSSNINTLQVRYAPTGGTSTGPTATPTSQ